MSAFTFNAATVAPDEGRVGALPAGWHPVIVDEAEQVPTKSGTGAYIKVRFSVLEGPNKGSKCWQNFNVVNDNPQAVEIGYRQLSSMMHAMNVLNINDLSQLLNHPLFIKTKVGKASGDYEPQAEVTAHRPIGDQMAKAAFASQGGAAPAAGGARPPAPPAPPAAAAAPAWQPPAPPAAAPAPAAPAPAAPAAGGWQPPAAAQPWQQPAAPVAAPAPAPAPAAAPVQQQAPVQQPELDDITPPWMREVPPAAE